ncbi:hypothetical protein AgCh_009177 [Apium graveolens]
MAKAPFTGQGERATERLGLIHSDVCGPMRTMAKGGFYYFITFTDDFSRCGYVYLLKNNSDSFKKFKEYKAEVEKQTGDSIKVLRSDHGREYLSLEFKGFLKECGIVSQLTPSGTPQWNGVSERRNRTLLDMVVHRSSRARHEPERYYEFLLTQDDDVMLIDNDEPLTYQEVMNCPDSERWLEAMKYEMELMYQNKIWTSVDPPEGAKHIGCKWVFKKKTDMDVAMVKSIKILLAIAAYYDYEIWQMDVKTAFLIGSLEEDVYMIQPEGFVDPKFSKMVFKELGFIQNEDEPCVYKKVSGSHVAFLVLYVDDILLIGNDIPSLQVVKTWLGNSFSMKDLGDATYILGIKIYRDRSRKLISLSQSTYIDKVLHHFGMQEEKIGYVSISHGILISKDNCPKSLDDKGRMSKVPYASAIESVMYAMICTRPDVSYALIMLRRYQSNPGEGHWTSIKNILKYLKRTKDSFLVYGGDEKLVVKG